MPAWIIDSVFERVFWPTYYWKGDKNDKNKNIDRKIFDYIKEYFMNTKLMFPDGTVRKKFGKIPSGSMFTSPMGSTSNNAIIVSVLKIMGIEVHEGMYLGDDSLVFISDEDFERKWDLDNFISLSKSLFNMTLHPDKFKVNRRGGTLSFLGYQFNGNRLHRSTDEWFKLALYVEDWVPSLEVSASRLTAFYLLGGCNDLEFARFWRFFHQAYGLHHYEFDPGKD